MHDYQLVINTLGQIIDQLQATQLRELDVGARELANTDVQASHRAQTHANCAYFYRQLITDITIVYAKLTTEYAEELQSWMENLPEWQAQAEQPGTVCKNELRLLNGGKSDDDGT